MQKNLATAAGIIVVIAMAAGIVHGVRAGNAAITVFSFLAGLVLLFLLKRGVTAVIEDEWTLLVEQKAAGLSADLTSLIFTITGLILITVSSPVQNYDQAVYAIAAVLVTLAVIRAAAGFWFARSLRGSGPGRTSSGSSGQSTT